MLQMGFEPITFVFTELAVHISVSMDVWAKEEHGQNNSSQSLSNTNTIFFYYIVWSQATIMCANIIPSIYAHTLYIID